MKFKENFLTFFQFGYLTFKNFFASLIFDRKQQLFIFNNVLLIKIKSVRFFKKIIKTEFVDFFFK